jgi:hypothetical protein
VLREQIGVDPSNLSVVLNLAAVGITNGTWRNSPLEDWHGEGRIHDGGMLRTIWPRPSLSAKCSLTTSARSSATMVFP